MREAEDRVTLRDSFTPPGGLGSVSSLFETLTVQMNLTSLLDLPLLALSNGQTRRARILKAILEKPELLLLDEPLSKVLSINVIHRNGNIDPSSQLVLTLSHGRI